MSNLEDMKSVLKETLEKRGVLGQLKARIRAEIFQALDDESETKPRLSHENMLINELIREYLIFNNYKYSESVFTAEAGQPRTSLDRAFLCNELNISQVGESQNVPLLYSMLTHFAKDVPAGSTVTQPTASGDKNIHISQPSDATQHTSKPHVS